MRKNNILGVTGDTKEMIEKIANDLVERFVKEELINVEMIEKYIYGAISLMERFFTIGTIVFIGIAVKMFLPTVCFLLFFLELRKRTGGFHLNKFCQCYIATIITYLIILAMGIKIANYSGWLFGVLVLSMSCIGIIGTVNHPNMHMDIEELAESKRAARIVLCIEGSIISGCTFLKADMLYVTYMSIAVILCAVLLCVAKLIRQEVTENEEMEKIVICSTIISYSLFIKNDMLRK